MHTSYHIDLKELDSTITLSEEESNHLVKVLRFKEGQPVEIANGLGLKAMGEIVLAHPKKCQVKPISFTSEKAKAPLFHIAIAPTKNMDRLEWFVEKATELGVDRITLLQCKNNERKVVKMERLEKIALSAMKQSQRFYLPILDELTPLSEFIDRYPEGAVAHCYDHESIPTEKTKVLSLQTNGPILIGPEGDFSLAEVLLAIKKGYTTIDLGKNRLRTETAALFALTQLIAKES